MQWQLPIHPKPPHLITTPTQPTNQPTRLKFNGIYPISFNQLYK